MWSTGALVLLGLMGALAQSSPGDVCVLEELKKRLHTPRSMTFPDIDVAVGFEYFAQPAEIEFTLIYPTHGWIGFGIAEMGSMKGADIAVIQYDDAGAAKITDHHSHDFVAPPLDKVMNWELLQIQQETILICGKSVPISTAQIRRVLDTCDSDDEPLSPSYLQNYFIAAYGPDSHRRMSYHSARRASRSAYVFFPEPLVPKAARGERFEIWTPTMQVPAGVTNYCYAKVNITETYFVTGYSPMTPLNVHHMGLFKAQEVGFDGDYSCFGNFEGMGAPQLQWAQGTSDLIMPSSLYIKLEPGEYYYEVHYENPSAQPFEGHTGLSIMAVLDHGELPPEDEVQILNIESRWSSELELDQGIVERRFEMPTECLEDLPPQGITMMVTVAHMHSRGRKMDIFRTRKNKQGQEITMRVFEQRSYDFNKQNPIWKTWNLQRGDKVYYRCIYNTTGETAPIKWGLKSDDEMCSIFLAANVGSPFRYAGIGLEAAGKHYAYCAASRPRFGFQSEIDRLMAKPALGAISVEIPAEPSKDAFQEKGRDRNFCAAIVAADLAAPAHNWLVGGFPWFIIGAGVINYICQRFIMWWCCRYDIRKPHAWMCSRAINLSETIMCITVFCLVMSDFNKHFKVETNEVYNIGGEALGYRYNKLGIAGDYCAAAYMMVILVKVSHMLPVAGDIFHHGTSLLAIFFLRNALEFDYAPSFYAFFAATMLMHSSASMFMYSGFLILKLFTPLYPKRRALFAKMFMSASALKTCVMLTAYVAGWWNYRLFFDPQTFYLRDRSTAEWNREPYLLERMSWREYLLNVPYSDILKVLLPIIWTCLFVSQSYNSWLQFTIGFYELRMAKAVDADEKNAVVEEHQSSMMQMTSGILGKLGLEEPATHHIDDEEVVREDGEPGSLMDAARTIVKTECGAMSPKSWKSAGMQRSASFRVQRDASGMLSVKSNGSEDKNALGDQAGVVVHV